MGREKVEIGTIRDFGGRNFIKTAGGWKYYAQKNGEVPKSDGQYYAQFDQSEKEWAVFDRLANKRIGLFGKREESAKDFAASLN